MADVFVSYSRDDRPKVERLAKALEERGFDVWWDPELLPGEQYAQKIGRVLNEAKAVIVVWSQASSARPWVLDEASVGRDRGVLVPILIEKIDAPLGFRAMQAEDLSDWPNGGAENFERVVRALAALRGAEAAPAAKNPPRRAAFSAPSATQKKSNARWLQIGGVALIAVLAIAAVAQISGDNTGGDLPDSEQAGPAATAADSYGLSKKQLGSMDVRPLIETALQTSSIDEMRKGASTGDGLGQLLLCLAYDVGVGVSADAAEARKWCEQAAGQGVAMATYVLHFYQKDGSGGLTADKALSDNMLQEAADGGDSRAQFDLGTRHLNGVDGAQKDDVKALAYLRKAAEQGYQNAQFNLAWMYENGRGVPQDYPTAMLWYQKLADEGSAVGTRGVGWMHYNGWGVEKDLAKAVELYTRASDMGDANATFNLGKMAESGEGMSKSLDEAVAFYKKASEQGYKDADAELKRLGIND